jgi:hypothetical protein
MGLGQEAIDALNDYTAACIRLLRGGAGLFA